MVSQFLAEQTLTPVLFPNLAALGTPYPAAAAQGWGELDCEANMAPQKPGKLGAPQEWQTR